MLLSDGGEEVHLNLNTRYHTYLVLYGSHRTLVVFVKFIDTPDRET